MAEKITCPACRAEISDDGQTVYKDSPRLSKAAELTKQVAENNVQIAKLEAQVIELTKSPTLTKKKGFADEFFGDC